MTRRQIPATIESEVLTLSRRRCCICFGLDGNLSRRKGQIAHLDHNPSNNRIENLVWLCLDHHDEYDSRTSQAKGLREKEVRYHRDSLYDAVGQYLTRKGALASSLDGNSEDEDVFLARGELVFYLAQFRQHEQEVLVVLKEISRTIDRHNSAMRQSRVAAETLLAAPMGRRDFSGYYRLVAEALVEFGDALDTNTRRFSVLATKMLDALTRASVVASDYETAHVDMFERKVDELRSIGTTLENSLRLTEETREAIKAWPRGTTPYNRGKRLALASLARHTAAIEQKLEEIKEQERHLREIMELL